MCQIFHHINISQRLFIHLIITFEVPYKCSCCWTHLVASRDSVLRPNSLYLTNLIVLRKAKPNSVHELTCIRRSVECAMPIMAVCTKGQSHHDHGRAGGLHLAFIFVCMSDDYASQNQRVINAVTWAELKYQSLSRVEERNFSTKGHWPWIAGPDQSRVFSEHVPRCLLR